MDKANVQIARIGFDQIIKGDIIPPGGGLHGKDILTA